MLCDSYVITRHGTSRDKLRDSPRSKSRVLAGAARATYVEGEVGQTRLGLPAPRDGCSFHLYCSRHVMGGAELAAELVSVHGFELCVTQEPAELEDCERMLIYLQESK